MDSDLFITLSSLRSAFQKVKANHGCAGVDRVTVNRFGRRLETNLAILWNQLRSGRYQPLPLLKILVEKKNGEPRLTSIVICVPGVIRKMRRRL